MAAHYYILFLVNKNQYNGQEMPAEIYLCTYQVCEWMNK